MWQNLTFRFLELAARPPEEETLAKSIPTKEDGDPDYARVPVGARVWVKLDYPQGGFTGRPVQIERTPRGFVLVDEHGQADHQKVPSPEDQKVLVARLRKQEEQEKAEQAEQQGKEVDAGLFDRHLPRVPFQRES